ncbi:GNAT family N-acetyltransferase [Pontibacter sp. G13]|uniref:GNAT family N-acetyltransferase n=1 Tax=Pontibacter sp. G13 TaxID=3074898 RepID=UPI00288C221A|nr:GNAT family N-acetyltransferase [Pontibacter sp. G13]WNJ20916.1 GNAT family N-acetyltransferase [Pontibacter sp. G13]
MSKLQTQVIQWSELSASQWDTFVARSTQRSVFARYDYLDAVSNLWQVWVVSDAQGWVAALPFVPREKLGFKAWLQLPFIQHLGILHEYRADRSRRKQLSLEAEVLKLLCEYWQEVALIDLQFSPNLTYVIPLVWDGCEILTRYTFQLDLQSHLDELRAGLAPPFRRNLQYAVRQKWLIQPAENPEGFLRLYDMQVESGHDVLAGVPEGRDSLERLANRLIGSGLGQVVEVRDADHQLLAAGLYAHEGGTTWYLMGQYLPEGGHPGAMVALMWNQIEEARHRGDSIFDFEGSMIQGVEHFFRKFGASPIPYLRIRKNQLPKPIQWIQALRS